MIDQLLCLGSHHNIHRRFPFRHNGDHVDTDLFSIGNHCFCDIVRNDAILDAVDMILSKKLNGFP